MPYFRKGDVVRLKDLADSPDKKDVDVEHRVKSVWKDRVKVHPMTGYSSYLGDFATHVESTDNLILIRKGK